MLGANGEPVQVQLPTIMVGWNEQTQKVGLQFDPTQFRSWSFIIAVLEMARRDAETNQRMQQMAQIQQQAAEAQQAEAIARSLKGR